MSEAPPPLVDLSSLTLPQAVDLLLPSLLSQLSILQAFRRDPVSEDDLAELLEESLDRRRFARMLEKVNVDESTPEVEMRQSKNGRGANARFRLSEQELNRWRDWTPDVGGLVLVHLEDDLMMPGQIIDLDYFGESCLPSCSTSSLFAVRLLDSDYAPYVKGSCSHLSLQFLTATPPTSTLTTKAQLIPFSLRPQPSASSSPKALSAYKIASSPRSFFTLASARESIMRQTWGLNRTRLNWRGESWDKHLEWLESEIREREEGDWMGEGKRREIVAQAKEVLGGLMEGRKVPLAPVAAESKVASTMDQSNPSRAQIKRSRKKLNELLSDPLLGPSLSTLDLTSLHTLLTPPPPSYPSTGAATGRRLLRAPSPIPTSAIPPSRKRAWREVMYEQQEFEDPLGVRLGMDLDLERGEDGWTVVKKRRGGGDEGQAAKRVIKGRPKGGRRAAGMEIIREDMEV